MRNANVIDFIFEPFFENNISKTLEKNGLVQIYDGVVERNIFKK